MRHPSLGLRNLFRLAVSLAVLATTLAIGTASAQTFKEPWNFKQRNGTSIAVVMKQLDSSSGTSSTLSATDASSGSSGYSSVVLCGGTDKDASSTANNTCIIIGDNTYAEISTGQTSNGDQKATSSTKQTTIEQIESVEKLLE